MLDRLFGWGKRKEEPAATTDPVILFGRYSDNNKTKEKVSKWTEADNLFKEKKYGESFDSFFQYLRDDIIENVKYERNGAEGKFEFLQGSKIVRGYFNQEHLQAEVTLAKMEMPSVPVMRRLLEMNFNLYYSRYALDQQRLCMRFDSDIETANPNKLYYGLKELSTKADKQDDLLVQDFTALQTLDSDHIDEIPAAEKEVKYEWMMKWIKETTDLVASLDADKFSGGIAYLLLALVYRIDFLVVPEGKLLNELEEISNIYFKKDERPTQEKNRDMVEAFKKVLGKTKEEVFPHLFRSRHTFAIVNPQTHKTIADAIYNANQNVGWYRDNNYPHIATQISEYGVSYCQYSYSLPRPITELFQVFMMVMYSDYFAALGFKTKFYDKATAKFETEAINARIKQILDQWQPKYANMNVRTENIKYDNLVNFAQSFTTEIEFLNMETK